jgi:hypothetical protein
LRESQNLLKILESITVLPFQNRGAEPDTEYLSDGLAESRFFRLWQIPNQKVIPTSSVISYKNKEIDPVTVGNKLGANAVSPQKRVANLWTEFSAQRRYAMMANGKKPQNPSKLVVAATFEKAKT